MLNLGFMFLFWGSTDIKFNYFEVKKFKDMMPLFNGFSGIETQKGSFEVLCF